MTTSETKEKKKLNANEISWYLFAILGFFFAVLLVSNVLSAFLIVIILMAGNIRFMEKRQEMLAEQRKNFADEIEAFTQDKTLFKTEYEEWAMKTFYMSETGMGNLLWMAVGIAGLLGAIVYHVYWGVVPALIPSISVQTHGLIALALTSAYPLYLTARSLLLPPSEKRAPVKSAIKAYMAIRWAMDQRQRDMNWRKEVDEDDNAGHVSGVTRLTDPSDSAAKSSSQ